MKNQNRRIPKIRFVNFNDKWNYKTLDEISNAIEYGINAPAKDFDGIHKYLRITDIDDTSRLFLTEKLSSPDVDFTEENYENYKLQKNDLLFARTGASVGKTYLYRESDGEVYYAGFLIRARLHDSYDENFVFQQTLTDKYKQFIDITSQRSGQPGVNGKEYGDWKIGITSYSEQSVIGSLFRTLDDLLSSYKDNLANYQSLKATMLSKIFPKAGQTVPEIRLNGFDGEWEVKKLKNVVQINPKSALPEKFKYIDLESVVGTRINKIREEYKETAPSRAQRLAEKGDIFYQTVRPYQKNNYLFKLDDVDYVFSSGYAQLRPKRTSCDSDFLLTLLQDNKFLSKVLDRCTGTSYPAINAKDLVEISIVIPKVEEQQAIGSYFSNLDNLINSHQEKISQLETLKKKLLQDMFI